MMPTSPRRRQVHEPFDGATIALTVGAVLAWLVVSGIFLEPLLADPSQAIRGDHYWEMSEWFGSGGPWPHTHFGPGYPFLIFILRKLGTTMFGLLVLQKLMLGIVALAVYRIARTMSLSRPIAITAAGAFAVFPVAQANASLFFAETLYLAMMGWGVAIVLAASKAPDTAGFARLAAGFLLIGASALARGNALVVFGACALIGLIWMPRPRLFAAVLVGALPILGWSAMNYHWYGHFKPTSSGDAAIAASIVGPVMRKFEGKPPVPGPEAWIEGRWQDQYPNQFELSLDTRDKAIQWMRAHPWAVFKGNVEGWFKALLGPGRADFEQLFGPHANWLSPLSLALRALLLAGLVAFFVGGSAFAQPQFAIFLASMLAAHVFAGGAAGYSRFGYPVDAFSVIAVAILGARWRARHSPEARGQDQARAQPARRPSRQARAK